MSRFLHFGRFLKQFSSGKKNCSLTPPSHVLRPRKKSRPSKQVGRLSTARGSFPPATCEGSADGHEQAWASEGAVPAPRGCRARPALKRALPAPRPCAACLASVGSLPREPGLHPCPRACAARAACRARASCACSSRVGEAWPARASAASRASGMVPRESAPPCRASVGSLARESSMPWRGSVGSLACESAQPCQASEHSLAGGTGQGLVVPFLALTEVSMWEPRWCRTPSCLPRAVAPRLLREMVPRAIAMAARDGAARYRDGCARWCRTLTCWLRTIVPCDGAARLRAVAT